VPSLRQRVDRASLPVISALSRLPRPVPFLLVLALMVAGILVPGWGWVLLGVVVLFLAWTLYLAWPALEPTPRLMRATILLLAAAITLTQALPRT
jgi:hypothetical protein